MILASLTHARSYECLGARFKVALDFLRNTDLTSLAPGRVNVLGVEGDDVFALPQIITTKPADQCKWEAHRKYADIQMIVSGTEKMGVGPLDLFNETTPFDPAKDVAFFQPKSAEALGCTSVVTVPTGYFTIFLPEDVHMPLIWSGSPESVKKVVMKVRV